MKYKTVPQKILHSELPDRWKRYLQTIDQQNDTVRNYQEYLESYQYDPEYSEDLYIWITCILALKAVSLGNFGVGSVVIDPKGDLIAWGHNEVFNPYFDSHKHAEMQAMDSLETAHKNINNIREYRLFTSIECCPMCLVRIINSGIGNVIHAAWDGPGGMVHKIQDLPQIWKELSRNQSFRQANCSPVLSEAANNIFQTNLEELYRKLEERTEEGDGGINPK